MPSRSRPFDVLPDSPAGTARLRPSQRSLPSRPEAALPRPAPRYCRRTSARTASAAARRLRSSATTASGALARKPWLSSLARALAASPCAFCALLTRRVALPLDVHQTLEIEQRLDPRAFDRGEAPGRALARRRRPRPARTRRAGGTPASSPARAAAAPGSSSSTTHLAHHVAGQPQLLPRRPQPPDHGREGLHGRLGLRIGPARSAASGYRASNRLAGRCPATHLRAGGRRSPR